MVSTQGPSAYDRRDAIVEQLCPTPVQELYGSGRGRKHGDDHPMQLGCFRPNQDCSATATPIPGLYVCGASPYPGGLILGGPGYLAANRVAEDLGLEKWWKPTPEMEKYTRTYLE